MKALIIIDHGSTRQESNNLLHQIKSLLQKKRPQLLVEVAHMELASPSISDAVKQCIKNGATRLVFHPYMLGPGRHVNKDIPELVKNEMRHYPTVSFEITPPLGLDDLLVSLILKRAAL
ncbi:cobalamin biosynthesis protein CbiX [Candidatus Marinamargulisbacteria bacterium SCGC AAA071-K20]|nr:cobalamin biosynthesis protein CbiX [Candidatus Marinamargulisbacteria bacterium SCGC AAA071-K20]